MIRNEKKLLTNNSKSKRSKQVPSNFQNETLPATRKTILPPSGKKKNQKAGVQIAAIPTAVQTPSNSPEGKQSTGLSVQESASVPTKRPISLSELAKKASGQLPEDVRRAFNTDDIFLLPTLVSQIKLASFIGHDGDLCTSTGNHMYILGLMQSIGPRDFLETLLAMQMSATHGAAMRAFGAANLEDQTQVGKEMFLNRAVKLVRTFMLQMETLKKHRSNGEQHCTVEHVHVHNGGQAVVGTINQGRADDDGADEDGEKKKDEKK